MVVQIGIMQSILAKFLHAHNEYEAWWFKIQILPKANSHPTQDVLSPLDEAPGEYCVLIIWLSKKVKSVDLPKVLNYNDSTTSLVKVPHSANQSGFKKQARWSRWVHQILQWHRLIDSKNNFKVYITVNLEGNKSHQLCTSMNYDPAVSCQML
jgi:hypothetical protein